MARPYFASSLQPEGHVEIKETTPDFFVIFFTPPMEALPSRNPNPEQYKRPIFSIDNTTSRFTLYPYQVWGAQPMSAKYYKLASITLEIKWHDKSHLLDNENISDFLYSELPSAFSEDYNYGLGFKKSYRSIPSMLEGFGVESLLITNAGLTTINVEEKKASITRADLEKIVRRIDGITQKIQKISSSKKKEATSEIFFQLLANDRSDNTTRTTTAELANLIGVSSRLLPDGATKKEQKEAIEVIRQNSRRIANEQPGELVKLKNDIELTTIEELINKFDSMLSQKLPESHWQKLLEANPFILNLALGVPVVKVQGQASVGGHKLSGPGNKIADFVVKNSITNNAAIVEIKTPSTKLLNSKEYRSGTFAPSNELVGAIAQVLDQIHNFQRDISTIKNNSREHALESYFVVGILIVGLSLNEQNEQKSFELFRGNSKSVQIVTFDELLKKLKDLHSFLGANRSDTEVANKKELIPVSNEDLPF